MSLFPFLSILVCLMGILAFIMVALVLISTFNPDVAIELEGQSEKQPVFVECHGSKMLLHPTKQVVPLLEIDKANSLFVDLVDRISKKSRTSYVIVFIYPDGISCFNRARAIVEARKVDLGFEPVLAGWKLKPGA